MMGLNNLEVDIPWVGSSCPLFPGWIEIQNVGFCRGRKREDPEKNPAEQGREPTKNSTYAWHKVRESNPGHSGVKRALSTLRHPPPLIPNIKYYSHKHITERKWIWLEWNFETNFDENWKLLFGRNFLPKDYVEVGSKKNNAKAWKTKKEKTNSNGTNTWSIILSFSRKWLGLDNRLVLAFAPL